jgi:hypothetical protein
MPGHRRGPGKYPDTAPVSAIVIPGWPAGQSRSYQWPHGSRAVTATAANSSVRYAMDRWNRRIGVAGGPR